jgi:hypothetical protein
MVGRTVFLNPYLNSAGVDGAFEDGAYTGILRHRLIDFFRSAPPELSDIRNLDPQIADGLLQYQSEPERMVDALMSQRTVRSFWVLFKISESYFGAAGDRLFLHVALEQYRLHPRIFWNVIKQGVLSYSGLRACEAPTTGFPWEYSCTYFFHVQPADQYMGFPQFGPYTGMDARTARVLGEDALPKLETPFIAYATTIFPPLYRLVVLCGAVLTCAGLLFGFYQVTAVRSGHSATQRQLPTLCAVSGVYLMYAVPMVILVEPEFRYVSSGGLPLLMSGLLSLRMLFLHAVALPARYLGGTERERAP